MLFFECCCQSVEDAVEAQEGGAGRIELCSRLEVGGVTPSGELIRQVLTAVHIPVNILVRPRAGGFVYDDAEAALIINTILDVKYLGVNGIVCGALTPQGDVDMPFMRRVMYASSPLEVTFHRAFDECANPQMALEDIISLGCKRLLTSGQKQSAPEGARLISELCAQAGGRIIIMPGAGIKPDNAAALAKLTQASEYHGSAHGLAGTTDREVVRAIVNSCV